MVEVTEKWGFGMAPPKPSTERERLIAAEVVCQVLAFRDCPPVEPQLLDALSLTKGLFNRVAREDQWDWFTVMGQLGYPSLGLARKIASKLSDVRIAIRDQDTNAFQAARRDLARLPTHLCLLVFLGKAKIADEEGVGWIYILSTRELRDLLKIGMTTRTVEQRVDEINRATGVAIPFGVRRCWRVLDPSVAERAVHAALAQYRVRNDREFFRIDFRTATEIVNETLNIAGLEIRTLNSLASLGNST